MIYFSQIFHWFIIHVTDFWYLVYRPKEHVHTRMYTNGRTVSRFTYDIIYRYNP